MTIAYLPMHTLRKCTDIDLGSGDVLVIDQCHVPVERIEGLMTPHNGVSLHLMTSIDGVTPC
jgi:hypothetical protein